ncbi:MAG TPA: hypothetical protein VGC42_10220, partial [Kofleriaceae bacterium]
MTEAVAVARLGRLVAVAAGVAALELVWVRRAFADDGPLAWPVLRRDWPRRWRPLADRVFGYRGFVLAIAAQLIAALALPWTASAVPAWLIAASTLLVAIRCRGSYNGGSDAMLLIVAVALGLARAAPGAAVAHAGLGYAGIQLVLSYVIAGVAKLPDPAWRTGRALPVLVRLPHYRVPGLAIRALSRPAIARAAAWATLTFECAAPVALVGPTSCAAVLAVGAVFHLANAWVFGLDRFLWSWL